MECTTENWQKLAKDHYWLVHVIARKLYTKPIYNMTFEDFVSVGTFGLISAAKRYKQQMGSNFKTYSEYRIRGAILDELRTQKRRRQMESSDAFYEEPVCYPPENEDHITNLIQAMFTTLTPRQKQVIELMYFKGLQLKEVGGVMSVSESRVCQIHGAVLEKLKKYVVRHDLSKESILY